MTIHKEDHLTLSDVANLFVRVRMRRIRFTLGAVVDIHQNDHQVVGVGQAAFCPGVYLLYWKFIVMKADHISTFRYLGGKMNYRASQPPSTGTMAPFM